MTKEELKRRVELSKYDHFGEAMPDGRLVEPSNGRMIYKFHEAIAEVERLGRPLTREEAKKYEIVS